MDRKEEINRIIRAGGLILVAIVMSVISWVILPDLVSMQFQGMQSTVPPFPKLLAVLIAFGFSAILSFNCVSVGYCPSRKQRHGL